MFQQHHGEHKVFHRDAPVTPQPQRQESSQDAKRQHDYSLDAKTIFAHISGMDIDIKQFLEPLSELFLLGAGLAKHFDQEDI